MAKKTISMTLSSKSIQSAIKELEKYRDSLQAKCDLLVSTHIGIPIRKHDNGKGG